MDNSLINTLKNMGIYDLRNYARSVGVAKPTTLKREELINAILDINSGIQEPVQGITRGRKPKNKVTANELISKYSNEYAPSTTKINCEISTNMPKQIFNSIGENEETYLKRGNIVIEDENLDGYFICGANKIIVPNKLIKIYNISNNEYISAICTLNGEEYIVKEVLDRLNLTDVRFENLKVLSKTRKLSIIDNEFKEFNKNYSINCGQCIEVNYGYKTAPEHILLNLINGINSKNTEIFALLTDEFNNQEIIDSVSNSTMFLVLDELKAKIEKMHQTLSYVKNSVQDEKDCVLIIGNLSLIISALKEFYVLSGNTEIISSMLAIKEIMQVLALARQTESGSLTIFVLNGENYLEELKPLFNAKLKYENVNGALKLSGDSFSIY